MKSSDHFVMSAVMVRREHLSDSIALLTQLRRDLGRRPGDVLHWRNFSSHSARVHAAKQLGSCDWLEITSVVVCKRMIWESFGRTDEAALRSDPGFKIAWANVDPKGGSIDQPARLQQLQLADIAASATFKAFEKDEFGNTETRYLKELSPRLYRGPGGRRDLTSYGLKLLPNFSGNTKAAYPWVAAL